MTTLTEARRIAQSILSSGGYKVTSTDGCSVARALLEHTTDAAAGMTEVKSWRCFHCDEVFTDAAEAKAHFGPDEGETCACHLNADQRGWLGLYRESQEELDQYRRQDNESYREFYRLGSDHSTALRRAEERGYEKGLADGRGLTSSPPERTP